MCMGILVCYYNHTEPTHSAALLNFWWKMMILFGNTTFGSHKERILRKKEIANLCNGCGKEDSEDKEFKKCGICKYVAYCGTECQLKQWPAKWEGGGDHIAECRQLAILHNYYRPRYAREIREAIIRGDDPKTMDRLQTLRTALGLDQLEYQNKRMSSLLDKHSSNNFYVVGRKNGKLYIGSTPNNI